jgi:hypothetical protein
MSRIQNSAHAVSFLWAVTKLGCSFIIVNMGFDSIAGEELNGPVKPLNKAPALQSPGGQGRAEVPTLFTNLNVTVWGKGKENEPITVPIRARIKITASELHSGNYTADNKNRSWALRTKVTLDRMQDAKDAWNRAAKATYDSPNPPTADGWIYPNFLWLMTGCGDFGGAGAWNDCGIVWVDNGAEVERAFNSTKEWHGKNDESKAEADTIVDTIECSSVYVVIKNCPNKGTAKVFVFYADFREHFKRETGQLPPPWGLFLVQWELSKDGELTFRSPIKAGDGETIPNNCADAFEQLKRRAYEVQKASEGHVSTSGK